ncbi:MAG: TatD family hydrolase [Chloroflexi bacterium]|nr:TatD family hydrolase [Chloroflexota bacterium]
MYSDAHIHLDLFPPENLESILRLTRAVGVDLAITVATSLDSSRQAIALSESAPDLLWAGVGLHPWEAVPWDEDEGEQLRALARSPRVKVISEIGLDYSHGPVAPPREQQQRMIRQIGIAHDLKLPIMTHSDPASQDDLLKLLRSEGAADLGGIIHGFRGDYRFAANCLDLGFAISFGTLVLRPDGWEQYDVIRRLPRGSIVIETDAAGGEDGSAEVIEVAQRLATALDLTPDQVGALTTANLRQALRL